MTLTQPRVILAPYVDLGVNSAVRVSATCECEESEDELPNQSSGQRGNGGAMPIRDARAGALSSSSSPHQSTSTLARLEIILRQTSRIPLPRKK